MDPPGAGTESQLNVSQELGGDAAAKAVNTVVLASGWYLKPWDWLDHLEKSVDGTGLGDGGVETEAAGPFHRPPWQPERG